MPAKTAGYFTTCRYCNVPIPFNGGADHISSPSHIAAVKRFKRSAAYRNRQGSLPFPSTIHDPPKLR